MAPIASKQTVAERIPLLLNSGGKSGVPRINAQNQEKLIPTDALAMKKPDFFRSIR